MITRRRVIVAVCAVIVTVSLVVVAVQLFRRIAGDGPLFLGSDEFTSEFGSDAPIGGTVVWGGIIAHNQGSDPLTIERVMLNSAGDTSGVEIIGFYIFDLGEREPDGTTVGLGRQWPPPYMVGANFHPAVGFVIQPDAESPDGYQIIARLVAAKPGEWLFSSYSVIYEVAGRKYLAHRDDRLRICIPDRSACKSTERR